MRTAAIFSEAIRDVRTGTTRVLLFGLLFGLLLSAGCVFAVSDSIRALGDASAYRASGASVTLLRAESRIEGSACDALEQLPGVRASGAIRATADDLVARALPGAPIPTKDISPGFRAVVNAESGSRADGILLSTEVAVSLGLSNGKPLETNQGPIVVSGRFEFPDDGRQGELGYSALIPQIPNEPVPYDECWVDAWPENRQITSLMRTTILPGRVDAEQPTTLQLNSRFGATFHGATAIASGASRFAPAGTALGALVLGVVSMRLRRLELASARHAGVSREALTLGQLIQALAWISAGAALVAPTALILAQAEAPTREIVLLLVGKTVITGALAAVAGVVLSALKTRERHLFRYFKER